MSISNQSTAALLIGYKRSDFLQKRLSELSKNLSIPILVSIDGSDKITEKFITTSIIEFSDLHPQMNIRFNVQKQNLGLAQHVTKAISEVLSEFDQVIVIEDDIILSENFIVNMLNGFDIMKATGNFGVIGGFSMYSNRAFPNLKAKWRESVYFPAWGWGIDRECWREYQLEIPINYQEVLSLSQTWKALSPYRKEMWCYRFEKVKNSNPSTWDYQMQYLLFRLELKALLTTNRISDNEGFESIASSNTKGKRPRWMGKENVFDGIVTTKISKLSKLYQFGDVFTIAGDKRLSENITKLRKLFHI